MVAPLFAWVAMIGHNRSQSGPDMYVARIVDGKLQIRDESPFQLIIGATDKELSRTSTFNWPTFTYLTTIQLPDDPNSFVGQFDESWSPKRHTVWYPLYSGETHLAFRCEPDP